MRISLNWLKELVPINLTPEELAKTLTIAGFEVEDIEDRTTWADGVVIGRVIECDRHPNADKLSLCQVDIGGETPSQIVCGAPNVRKDIFVPVATLGSYLPKVDLKIKPAKLRGVESKGMICSLAELGLAKDSEGIKILEGELQAGQDVRPLLGLDDVILDVTATANRADALSMVGIAREVSALTGGELTLPTINSVNIDNAGSLNIDIQETEACPAYIGTTIENVTIAPSPEWLQWRLEASGVRPINNVVDITNYILLEWGQPLHAFDREKLITIAGTQELSIGVRFANEGESLTTLDGQERKLTTQNLVITVGDKPVALAGIMGGEESEVDDNTKNVVLEAALFEPVPVRRSGKAQGLRTEASTRYERGVNQVELENAYARAVELLVGLADGKVTNQGIADNRRDKFTNTIQLRIDRLHSILGKVVDDDGLTDVAGEDVVRILSDLGCTLEVENESPLSWLVTVPPYRYRDLEREIDLIEEVARLYGYDRFQDTLPAQAKVGFIPSSLKIKRKIVKFLTGLGLNQLIQYSLVSPEKADIKIANPLFSEYSALRTNIIDGLIESYAFNTAQGNGGLNGFEIGRIFWDEEGKKAEGDALAGILGGDLYSDGIWTTGGKPPAMTWYDAKGVLESLFEALKAPITYKGDSDDDRLHPGRTASLWLRNQKIGVFGQLHPKLAEDKDLNENVYVFELHLDPLIKFLDQAYLQTPKFKAFSTYPAVDRDIALFAPIDLTVGDIVQVIRKAGGRALVDVTLFDEYKGDNVEEGKRSLAFNLVYQSIDKTLKDTDVDPVHNKIRKSLTKKFDVELRS